MKFSNYTRRDFMKTMGLGAAATAVPFLGNCGRPRLDRYGGLKSVRFDATGFFRVEKGDRWWFVTPEGSAFLSFGMNHPDQVYLLQEYNIDFWREKFGFQDPSEDALREGFIARVMTDLKAFGMNTIGTHARKENLGKITVPYIQGLFFAPNSYWMNPQERNFPDVFSDGFRRRCQRVAQRLIEPRSEDPYLMGYTLTDSPVLTYSDAAAHGQDPWGGPAPEAPTWPRVLRNLGPGAAGKKAFVALMRERYPTVGDFNRVYKTRFSSFGNLLNAEGWSSARKDDRIDDGGDNHAFLLKILDRYYRVSIETIRERDANHMIFGDIINAQTPPPDDVVALIAGFSDVVAYQFYGGYDEQVDLLDRWSGMTGKPLFHADSSFSVAYEEMPNPVGAVCPDQETRAKRFLDFATRAFSRPDFIGWNWCGWMDSWEAWRKERQHTGLQDPFGEYDHPMPEKMSWFGARMYDYGLGKRKPLIYGSS